MIRGLVAGTVQLQSDEASCVLRFDSDEPFFKGHFPGHPIVPGVIMLEALVALARQWTGGGDVAAMSEAKFRHEVSPNAPIACTVRRAGRELLATAHVDGQPVAQAHFVLETS